MSREIINPKGAASKLANVKAKSARLFDALGVSHDSPLRDRDKSNCGYRSIVALWHVQRRRAAASAEGGAQ